MMTDPARMRKTDPGDPDKCPVFDYHKIYTPEATRAELTVGCRLAGIGCVDCKKTLLKYMDEHFEPFRVKRSELATKLDYVKDVIREGNKEARQVAGQTMAKVKDVMNI